MRFYLCALIAIFLLLTSSVQAAMTSTNFIIGFDSLNSGGSDNSTSTNYSLYDTIGEQATGYGTSTNYTMHAGYRQTGGETIPSLSFSLGVQENQTETAYTAFSTSTNSVIAVSNGFFATDSYIGVVENVGLNQKIAIGKIIAVNGLVLTVDKWDGQADQISGTPAGSDDFIYRMDDHQGAFGQLNTSLGKTFIVRTEVNTNAANGYTLRIQSDGYLRSSSTTHIMDVNDGSVSLGSEEYGARVFGNMATSTGMDFSVTTTSRDIQQSTSTAENDRVGMVYKATITPATPAGNYSQTVRYLLTANF